MGGLIAQGASNLFFLMIEYAEAQFFKIAYRQL